MSMKNRFLIVILIFCSFCVKAQKEQYDIATYQPPAGWQKESGENYVSYSIVNNKTRAWAKLAIYKSIATKGTIDQDFTSEWNDLVAKTFQIQDPARGISEKQSGGWTIKSGSGAFKFNGADAAVNLTTTNGFGKCISIVFLMNNDTYLKDLENFMAGFTLKGEDSGNKVMSKSIPAPKTNTPATQPNAPGKPTTSAAGSGAPTSVKAAFTTTNFDNGWTSVAKEDWVEVSKGGAKVLLHYPTDKIDMSSMDYRVIGQNAWNTLVAPRYSSIADFFQLSNNLSYEPGYFLSATLTENASNRRVFVALFRKGSGDWIEFICPDRDSFIKLFGVDSNKMDVYYTEWKTLNDMSGYNRFAVGASDLTGKWTTSFSGLQQYYNVYTGASAGATSYASSQFFEFTGGNAYRWEISVASGPVGNAKFQNVKSAGVFRNVNNWQVHFSEMEGKPKTYDAYFSFIKGARILWLSDVTYPSYTGFFKAK